MSTDFMPLSFILLDRLSRPRIQPKETGMIHVSNFFRHRTVTVHEDRTGRVQRYPACRTSRAARQTASAETRVMHR